VSEVVLATTVGVAVSFVAAGLVTVRVRPRSRVSRLLIGVGLLWALAKFLPGFPALSGIRSLLVGAWAAVLAHLVVAFPTGRLGGLAPRAVVGLAYLSAAVVGLLGTTGLGSSDAVRGAATLGAVLSGLAVIGVQLARWRTSTVARRRSLTPVWPLPWSRRRCS
jgi:hypothetical protein